ncbi:MAG: hypothetical protein JWR85_3945 [Marmoricola sp.]|nr:hypothetical protein [Marmoricola sp.]
MNNDSREDLKNRPEAVPPAQPQYVSFQAHPGRIMKFVKFLGLLLLLALVAAGAFYWQQRKLDQAASLQLTTQKQVTNLQAQLASQATEGAKSAASTGNTTDPVNVSTDVVTGQVTSQKAGSTIVSGLYKVGAVREIWVEYGLAANTLDQATKHGGLEPGLGEPGSYANVGTELTTVKPTTYYFYRAAAKVDGKTVYGGVIGFQSAK